jgi:lipoprotein-anchoring transpeptidase ErfK/SrfK
MSRSSIALLCQSGLLLATMLVASPSRLHAETNSQRSLNLPSAVSTAPRLKPNTISNLVPVETVITQKVLTPSKQNPGGSSTGTVTSTSSKPVTSPNPTPTPKQPKANPAVVPSDRSAVTASNSQTPVPEVVSLILKLNEKQVYVYKGDKLVAKYPVAIGKKGTETPTGDWYVMEKIKNPGWTSFKNGDVLPPGKENPLGERWIGFWTDGKDMIGFHGTPNIKSVGTAASNGCVRMYNKHVKALYPLVKIGTIVKVVNE